MSILLNDCLTNCCLLQFSVIKMNCCYVSSDIKYCSWYVLFEDCLYYCLVICSVLCRGLWCDTLSSPSDTTALLGQTVQLVCAHTTNSGSFVTWNHYQTNGSQLSIFASNIGLLTGNSKPGKFAINGTYNLIINNVAFDDAGTYECKLWSLSPSTQLANLIVIGN